MRNSVFSAAFLLLTATALPGTFSPVVAQAPTIENAPQQDSLTDIRRVSEVPPSFRGGQQGFVKFIGKNLQYPPAAREKKTSGTVKVDFIVHEDGSCSNFKVVQSLGKEFDAEALRVLRLMPTWMPGKNKGKPAKVLVSVPVYFSMNTSLEIQKNPNKNKYR